MTVPALPINPATGNPWTAAEVEAAQAAIDAANTALGGDKSAEIAADANADAIQAAGGDANITDAAERHSLGLPPLNPTPQPVEPPPVVTPPPVTTPPDLSALTAQVGDLTSRTTTLESTVASQGTAISTLQSAVTALQTAPPVTPPVTPPAPTA